MMRGGKRNGDNRDDKKRGKQRRKKQKDVRKCNGMRREEYTRGKEKMWRKKGEPALHEKMFFDTQAMLKGSIQHEWKKLEVLRSPHYR